MSEPKWQCGCVLPIDKRPAAPPYHECSLPKGHMGVHLCWCGWGFDGHGVREWNPPGGHIA